MCTVQYLFFSNDKTKVYLLPENLRQLSNLNMGLVLVFLPWIDICFNYSTSNVIP